MSLERIKAVADQICSRLSAVRGRGEESTKQALILPMLDALGYDIWHPGEVCPEYEADFAVKKAGQREKVDIAVLTSGTPRIYIEVKSLDTDLNGHEGQLRRYFNATPSVTLGVLTNGVEWRFFTDTGDPNIMDQQPFFVSQLDAIDPGLDVLARFEKAVFSPEAIRDYATELRYTARMADFLRREFDLREKDPSDYFLRWLLKSDGMYDGNVNAAALERFRPIAKAAVTRVVREIVRRSIAAMDEEAAPRGRSGIPAAEMAAAEGLDGEAVEPADDEESTDDGTEDDGRRRRAIVTTQNELDLFAIAKKQFEQSAFSRGALYDTGSRRDVPLSLAYKDTQNYFSVYLNRTSFWVLRARLEGKNWWLAFNLDPAVGSPLVPPELKVLPPYAWAQFRVQVSSEQDLHRLQRVFYAAIESVAAEHQKPDAESSPTNG